MEQVHEEYQDHPVYKRLIASGPKRILALDGGGIRGALTLGYLEETERILRKRYNNPDFVLADYFDLVGGTSTGAIIATLIALGKAVEDIKALYLNIGKQIFQKRKHPLNIGLLKYVLSAEFDHTILERELEKHPELKDVTLGSKDFKTGLTIYAKRADAFETYIFHNHPRNRYYEENKGILITDLLRATSAAPTYFKPKEITFSDGESAVFIDGGVSMANNPSLMLFLMATITGYGYNWRKSKDHMLLVSVGTGYHKAKIEKAQKAKLLNRRMFKWAPALPDMFMKDATELNQYLMQYFSNARLPETINKEVGNLTSDFLSEIAFLDYCRYNISLDDKTLNSIGIRLTQDQLKVLPKMERGENAEMLYEIGKADAKLRVKEDHFPSIFDFGIIEGPPPIDQKSTKKLFASLFDEIGVDFEKFKGVVARQAKTNESVPSITTSGLETEQTAKPGNYIVKNQTTSQEVYVVAEDTFKATYQFARKLDEDWAEYSTRQGNKRNVFQVTENVLNALKLDKHFFIIADWGDQQYVSIGDYLVYHYENDEVYRIGREEFIQTYRMVEE